MIESGQPLDDMFGRQPLVLDATSLDFARQRRR
jgi:hypothetical protein